MDTKILLYVQSIRLGEPFEARKECYKVWEKNQKEQIEERQRKDRSNRGQNTIVEDYNANSRFYFVTFFYYYYFNPTKVGIVHD